MVLRKIGYIPGEQLPLEFGGMASDFTASGSASTMLLRAEEATRQQQQQQQQQHDTERPTQRARLKQGCESRASVAERRPFGEGEETHAEKEQEAEQKEEASCSNRLSSQSAWQADVAGSQRKRSGLRGDQ